jgi:NAD(P)H-flavin reductase
VADLVYADELDRWAEFDRVRVVRCVDPGGQTADWKGEVGFVPNVFEKACGKCNDPIVLVIGPPIMIKNTLPILDRMGVGAASVYTSIENRMKCGVGKCGRCNVGPLYVCKEGPVLTMEQLQALPADY